MAPGPWLKSVTKEEYIKRYNQEILDPQYPEAIWENLHKLAGVAEPVLLCWEKPPLTGNHFCHRRIVADWLEKALYVSIPKIE